MKVCIDSHSLHTRLKANIDIADMFRSLSNSKLPKEHVFSVTVGASSKQTLASWHLLEPMDVISAVAMLNGNVDAPNVGPASVVEGSVPETRSG